jgi:hypothetical protein
MEISRAPFFTKSTGYKMIEGATVVALHKTDGAVSLRVLSFEVKSDDTLGDVTYQITK